MIYFVKPVGKRGPVKIGYSGKPALRLSALQGGSPVRLELVGMLEGTQTDEMILHWRFREQHLFGEWFEWSRALQDVIRSGAVEPPIRADLSRPPRQPIPALRNYAVPIWRQNVDDQARKRRKSASW